MATKPGKECEDSNVVDNNNYIFSEFVNYVNEIVAYYERGCEEKYEPIKSDLRVLNEKINDSDLYLGVVGSFSSGKSTFINSVIHKNLLPTDAVQGTTVAASVLKRSDHSDLEISYLDGSRKTYSMDSAELKRKYQIDTDANKYEEKKRLTWWMRFIIWIKRIFGISTNDIKTEADSTRLNLFKKIISTEEMANDVSCVTLYYENANIPHNIAMVDTPGTESLNKRHNEVTKNAIDNICDAIVVIIPYDEPVSEELLEYVNNNLESHKQECIFVVTKVELLGDFEELPRLISVIKRRLENGLSINDAVVIPMPTLLHLKTVDDEMTTKFLDNIDEAEKHELLNMYEDGIEKINKILNEKRRNYIVHKIVSVCDRVETRLRTNLTKVVVDYDEENKQLQKDLVPELGIFENRANDVIGSMAKTRIGRLDGELSFINMIFSDFRAEMEKKIENCSSSQDLLYSLSYDLSPYFSNSQKKATVLLNDIANSLNKQIQELRSEYLKQYSRCGVSGNAGQIPKMTGSLIIQDMKDECERILQSTIGNVSSAIRSDTSGFFKKVKSFFLNPFAKHKEMALSQISGAIDDIKDVVFTYISQEVRNSITSMKNQGIQLIKRMLEMDRPLVNNYLNSTNVKINENTKNREITQQYIDGLAKYRNSMKEVV